MPRKEYTHTHIYLCALATCANCTLSNSIIYSFYRRFTNDLLYCLIPSIKLFRDESVETDLRGGVINQCEFIPKDQSLESTKCLVDYDNSSLYKYSWERTYQMKL